MKLPPAGGEANEANMKIGIDARFYGSIGKGLGRYTQKLIQHLEHIDKQNQYVIFLRKENFDEYQPTSPNFKKVLADYRWYSFAEQILFPLSLKKQKLDLMHFPHFNVPLIYNGKFVITIHDLILTHFPTLKGTTLNPLWYWIKYLAYKLAIYSGIKRSAKIFTVSEFTRNDILGKYSAAPQKIMVTYEACDDFCRMTKSPVNQVLKKYGIIQRYILYVGNAYPHKNLERLMQAFAKLSLKFPDLNLVLVGKEDFFYSRLKESVEKNKIANVKFLGYVDDSELDVLYRFSQCYVFPSLYEGFGLPPLEAMAKGTPVISNDHACMREILGDAALFINALDVNEIANAVAEVFESDNLRDDLIAKGYKQIEKYSWEEMAKKTLSQYLEC